VEDGPLKKPFDEDIRDRVVGECRSIMADHPEVEAISALFLSKQLAGVLPAMIITADGKPLRPDQNVRMFEVWVRVGMQLMINLDHGTKALDDWMADMARKLAHAKAEAERVQPQRDDVPGDDGP
jgi:hypothetical protein